MAQLRLGTAERLRERRQEICEAVIHRALSVAPPTGREAPGYEESLRSAIPSAIEYAFDAIERGEDRIGPIPAPIIAQAAAAAGSTVGLEVVLRRYAAGYSTLSDFLHQEVRELDRRSDTGYAVLQRDLTALFDRLVVEVSAAYRREEARGARSPRKRQTERIRRLLAGEHVDTATLEYPLEASHLAVIVSGASPEAAALELARQLDRRILIGECSTERAAIWLGGTETMASEELCRAARALVSDGLRFALGEPGYGVAGWRRSRRQAEAAFLLVGQNSASIVRYRDVALLAAALRDPDLCHFLTEAYLEPLTSDRSGLARTLRAFFETNRNASSAAAMLGISRQTVGTRLRVIEERLGRPLEQCTADLETALRLAELDGQLVSADVST